MAIGNGLPQLDVTLNLIFVFLILGYNKKNLTLIVPILKSGSRNSRVFQLKKIHSFNKMKTRLENYPYPIIDHMIESQKAKAMYKI